jgi:hypothetical protein
MRPRKAMGSPQPSIAMNPAEMPPGLQLPAVPVFPVIPAVRPGRASKRPALENEMSIDEIVCDAEDSIEELRGKLNEDEDEKIWMTKFSEFEIGDDGEELGPLLVPKGQQKELKELDEFAVFRPTLRVMVPPGVRSRAADG